MRTRLLHMPKRLLVALLLAGCQETSTDPQAGQTADQMTDGPAIDSASSSIPTRTTHFVANGDFAQVAWSEGESACRIVTASGCW